MGLAERPLSDRVRLLPGERARHTYLTAEQVRHLALRPNAATRDAILLASMTAAPGRAAALRPEHRRGRALHLADSKSGRPRVVPSRRCHAHPLPLTVDRTTLRKGFDAARTRKTRLTAVRFHDLPPTPPGWSERTR